MTSALSLAAGDFPLTRLVRAAGLWSDATPLGAAMLLDVAEAFVGAAGLLAVAGLLLGAAGVFKVTIGVFEGLAGLLEAAGL